MNMRIVKSSHGEFSIDPYGNVIAFRDDDAEPDDLLHLSRVIKFDVYEWMEYWRTKDLPSHIDILDLGYWYKDPDGEAAYVRPDTTWREGIAKDLLKRKQGEE